MTREVAREPYVDRRIGNITRQQDEITAVVNAHIAVAAGPVCLSLCLAMQEKLSFELRSMIYMKMFPTGSFNDDDRINVE